MSAHGNMNKKQLGPYFHGTDEDYTDTVPALSEGIGQLKGEKRAAFFTPDAEEASTFGHNVYEVQPQGKKHTDPYSGGYYSYKPLTVVGKAKLKTSLTTHQYDLLRDRAEWSEAQKKPYEQRGSWRDQPQPVSNWKADISQFPKMEDLRDKVVDYIKKNNYQYPGAAE